MLDEISIQLTNTNPRLYHDDHGKFMREQSLNEHFEDDARHDLHSWTKP
jgi:hypothetical protein